MQKILILTTVLALGACAAPNGPSTPAVTPETVSDEPTAPNAVPTVGVTAINPNPPKPKITSTELLGKDGTWVKAKLGEPTFVRSEKTANIWQYKNHVCVLNVFLYVEGDQNPAPHVLHFDARNVQGDNTNRERCLAALQD